MIYQFNAEFYLNENNTVPNFRPLSVEHHQCEEKLKKARTISHIQVVKSTRHESADDVLKQVSVLAFLSRNDLCLGPVEACSTLQKATCNTAVLESSP